MGAIKEVSAKESEGNVFSPSPVLRLVEAVVNHADVCTPNEMRFGLGDGGKW